MADFPTIFDETQKLWKGVPKPKLCDGNVSAGKIALAVLRSRNPQEIMQICDSEDTTMTCADVLSTSIKLAEYFKNIGLTGDDVVGILSPESTYVMPVALAAWFNGTPFQALNCTLEQGVVENLYSFSQPKIIFCDGLQYEKALASSASFKPFIYTLCNHLNNVPAIETLLPTIAVEETLYQAQPLKYGSNHTMAILTSSGTSGKPKGGCVPNSMCVLDLGFANASTKIFSTSGIDWNSGFLSFIINVLVGGTRIITSKPATPKYLLEIITKYKITFLTTISQLFLELSLLDECTKENMKSLKFFFTAGTFCSDNNLDKMRSILTQALVFYGYGLTEMGGIAGRLSSNKPNSVGRLFPTVRLKIIDTTTGQRLGCGEIGEICINQGYEWCGYYKNPNATAEILDQEGFVHTGDLGYMDEDNYLFIVGRNKDIMKYMGFQYSPVDIEQIISEIPDVLDVCVFGVFDEKKGDVAAAAVVKRQESTLTAADIMEYLDRKSEVPYKKIHYGVFFVQQLPKNTNGKILRQKIKDMCIAK